MDGERILDDLEAALTESLSAEEVAAISEFYRSPLGTRVRRVEVEGSSPEVRAEIESHRDELRAELNSDPERKALLDRVERALLASELSATIALSMVQSIAVAGAQGQPGADPESLAALEERIAQMHPMFVEKLRDNIGTTFFRTYRDLSTADLTEYVAFLETDKASAAYAGFYAAMNDIFRSRGREIGEAFGALMKQRKT
jgi:hypothetical protein